MRLACAVLVAALVASCQSSSERPPPPTCVGDCGLDPGLGSGMQPPGSGGAEGEGGSDGGTSKGVVLTGSLLVLNDDVNFVAGAPYPGITDLKTEGADGRTVTAQSNASDASFSITGVRQDTPVWVLATPENPTADDVLPALEPVRTDMPDAQGIVSANLALVHGTTIDRLFGLATVPLTNDTSKAQIILRLVDKTSTATDPPPLSGVSVKAAAEDTLYGVSGGFSDVATATDPTGVVVLANVGGAAYPGALVSVEFSGARSGGTQVRAVTGAVTLTTIGL